MKMEYLEANKKKKHETFGWDVFNEDTLYRSYKKRCKEIPFYKELYNDQIEERNV